MTIELMIIDFLMVSSRCFVLPVFSPSLLQPAQRVVVDLNKH